MRRAIIIAGAALALTACSDPEPQVVYRDRPVETATYTGSDDVDVLSLEAVWPRYSGQICDGLDELGGVVTPEIAQFSIDSLNEGYGRPISPAAERRLIELLEACP